MHEIKEREKKQSNKQKKEKKIVTTSITSIVLLREVDTSPTATINIALSGKHFANCPTTINHSVRNYDCDSKKCVNFFCFFVLS